MRHLLIAVMAALLIAASVPSARAMDPIRVVLDGRQLSFDVAPVIVDGSTLVPLRAIFEALGAEVSFEAATRTIRGRKGDTAVRLTVAEVDATVGDRPVRLAVPPQIVAGRTLVPLRFIAESLGLNVSYDAATRTVTLISEAAAPSGAPVLPADCGRPLANPQPPTVPATAQPGSPRPDPYYHRVQAARSRDGIKWVADGRVLFDHASVPDVTSTADGRLVLAWMDFATGSEQLATAFSADQGQTWGAANAVRIWGWDGKAVDPDIMEVFPGCFRLTFFGMEPRQSPMHTGPHQIYSAVGTDGVNYVLEEGVRVEYANIFDPDVVRQGDTWHLYLGYPPNTISATSTDGLTYTWQSGFRVQGGIPNGLAMPDGSLRLHTVTSSGLTAWTGADGLSFQSIGLLSGVMGADPAVVRLPDGSFFMAYKTFDKSPLGAGKPGPAAADGGAGKDAAGGSVSFGGQRHQVLSATSADGVKWTPDGQVLFDNASVPGAVVRDGVIYLYYVAAGGDGGPHGVVVAISTDGGKTFTRQPIQIRSSAGVSATADPDPILLADGSIRLYYAGHYRSPRGYALPDKTGQGVSLYVTQAAATTTDGVHFTEEPGEGFGLAGAVDPDVFRTATGWVMLVTTPQGQHRATATDGLTWQHQSPAAVGGTQTATIPVGGGFYTYYCTGQGIGLALTTDGSTWTGQQTVLAGAGLCDPTVVVLADGTYQMFYKRLVK